MYDESFKETETNFCRTEINYPRIFFCFPRKRCNKSFVLFSFHEVTIN